MANTINICVRNLRTTSDQWYTLPTSPQQLPAILDDYAVVDYENSGAVETMNWNISEYDSFHDINALAHIIADYSVEQLEAIGLVCSNDGNLTTALRLASVAVNVDNIPFIEYEPFCFNMPMANTDELVGLTWASISGLMNKLEEYNLDYYFDYEAYGRDISLDCTPGNYGFLDDFDYDDFPTLTREELYEAAGLTSEEV